MTTHVHDRPHDASFRASVRDELCRARERTLALCDLPDDQLVAQWSPLMSPMVWDLAHIAHYEELWLRRAFGAVGLADAAMDDLYDAFAHPRSQRPHLPILRPTAARRYAADVREAVLADLDRPTLPDAPFDDTAHELGFEGFVHRMVVQHEHQHCETLVATRQLMHDVGTPPPTTTDLPPIDTVSDTDAATASLTDTTDDIAHPRTTFTMGVDDDPWAYDNERPAHTVEVAPFALDRTPVTNAAYQRFVEAGGYRDDRWWGNDGEAWRCAESVTAPAYWREGDDGWEVQRFGTWRPLDPHEPVQHVCWYEAEAFARWAGRRLPTEAEWECAARVDAEGRVRRYPWGDVAPDDDRANLGQRRHGPQDPRRRPRGASARGVLGLIGDVWEWTSTEFDGYPGFRAFPYAEYSEVFFADGYRVLRGGSWAADPVAVRSTFRNWDLPIRRQIFCGFRTARSL